MLMYPLLLGHAGGTVCQCTIQAGYAILRSEDHNSESYIDDFAGIGTSHPLAQAGFDRAGTLMLELGLQESSGKGTHPATTTVWLGCLFDSINMEMSIPEPVIQEILHLLTT